MVLLLPLLDLFDYRHRLARPLLPEQTEAKSGREAAVKQQSTEER